MPAILIFSQVSHSHCGHFTCELTASRGRAIMVTEVKGVRNTVAEMVLAGLVIIVLTVRETKLAATLSRQMGASSRLARAG